MCNYLGYKVTRMQRVRLLDIEKTFGQDTALELVLSGFAYASIDVIIANENKTDVAVVPMHWEFIPPFVASLDELKLMRKGIDPKTGAKKAPIPWLNAKAENLLLNDKGKKAMWADAARSRRCLLVATHFFEWRWHKAVGEKKELSFPYLVNFTNEATPNYMAGIWTPWTDRTTGEMINTFAIVTTNANALMSTIHNRKQRQPTILPEALAYEWIMTNPGDERLLELAAYQLPVDQLQAHSIAKDFQTAADPLAAFNYENLPDIILA